MHKRIVLFICVVVLILVCALPAFAAGGSNSDYYRYSSLPIDTIRVNDGDASGSFAEWPFNVASEEEAYVKHNFFYATVQSTFNTAPYPEIFGDFLVNGSSFTLSSNLTYVHAGSSLVLSYYDKPTDITFTRVIIEFDYISVKQEENGLYTAAPIHMFWDSERIGVLNLHTLDVVTYIKKAYHEHMGEELVFGYDVLLQNFKITFQVTYDSDPNAFRNIAVDIAGHNNSGLVINSWFTGLQLRNDVALVSLGPLDWLVSIIEAFLRLELFPGFSIDVLLNLVISIVLAFWLVKLFS